MKQFLTKFKWSILGGIATILVGSGIALAAQPPANSSQVGTNPTNGYVLQTNGINSTWVATSTLGVTASYSRAATKVVCASNAIDTTDCDYKATASTADVAIQAAFDSLSGHGGEVKLSDGTFGISTTTFITASGTLVSGMGGGGTILKANSGLSGPIMQSNTKLQNVTIENIKFDASSASTTSGNAIGFKGFDLRNSVIQNNWFTGAPNEGIYLNGDSSLGWYNVVQNNDIDHNGIGTHFRFTEYAFVNNNAYSFNTTYGSESESDSDFYNQNSFDAEITGLYLPFGGGNYKVVDNGFSRFTNYGILMRSITQSTIIGNQFDGVPSGFSAIQNGQFGSEAGSQLNISDNYTTGSTNSGSSGYAEVSSTTNVNLIGNNFLQTTTPYSMNASSTLYTIHDGQRLTVTGTSTLANPLILNGVTYSYPSLQGSASTTLINDGSGNLTWNTLSSLPLNGLPGQFLGNSATNTPAWFTPLYVTVGPVGSGANYIATGTNDQVPINNAIAAVNAAGGGTVLVKKGSYDIASSTSITMLDNISLLGEGAGTLINIHTGNGVKFSTTSNASIENMHFDGSSQPQTAFNSNIATRIDASKNILINNNIFSNMYGFGIFIGDTQASPSYGSSTGIIVSNNLMNCNALQDCIGGGTHGSTGLSTTSDITIIANKIFQKTFTGGVINSNMDVNCLDIVRVMNVNVSNNDCHGSIYFGDEAFPNTYSKISGNIISPPDGPISISGEIDILQRNNNNTASNTALSLMIDNNILSGGFISVQGITTKSVEGVSVRNNQITTSTSTAQTQDGKSQRGIQFNWVKYSDISNNYIQAFNGTSTLAGIFTSNSTNITSQGNYIKDFAIGIDMNANSTFNNKSINDTVINASSKDVANTTFITHMDSNGRYGIGTSSPSSSLFLQGQAGFNPFIIASSTGSSLIVVNQSGNVGIGNTAPAYKIDLFDLQTANSGFVQSANIATNFTPTANNWTTGYDNVVSHVIYTGSSVFGNANGYIRGFVGDATNNTATSVDSTYGVTGRSGTQSGSAGSINSSYGVHGYSYLDGAGSLINQAFPVFSEIRMTASGTINTGVNFFADASKSSSGTIGTLIAFKNPDHSSIANNQYGILTYGNSRFGDNTLPTHTVEVGGSLLVTGTPTLSGVSDCSGTQYLQISSGLFSCGTPTGGGGGTGAGWATSTPNIISTNYPSATGTLVGINTTTPSQALTVIGNILIDNSNGQGPNVTFRSLSNAAFNLYNYFGSMSFDTGATTVGRINPNGGWSLGNAFGTTPPANGLILTGNVGIGTITPTTRLFVQGSGTTDVFNVASSSGSSMFIVKSSGNVGMGTSTPQLSFVVATSTGPAFSVSSAGVIQQQNQKSCTLGLTTDASGNINGCVTSDERLKTNIQNLSQSDILQKIKPVLYTWKLAENKDTQQHAGFIAQEVGQVLPQCQVSGGNGYFAVDPNCMIAELWLQVQNLPQNKVVSSLQDKWQDLALGLLFGYVIYNEIGKRRKK